MKLALLVYLASIVENLSKGFMVLSLATILLVIILYIMRAISKDFGSEKDIIDATIRRDKYVKPLLIASVVLFVFSLLIPKEKTIYIMTGAYITEEIVTNPRVQKIGNDVLEVVESKLSEMKGGDSTTTEDKPSK